jgi:hypothetical protein
LEFDPIKKAKNGSWKGLNGKKYSRAVLLKSKTEYIMLVDF